MSRRLLILALLVGLAIPTRAGQASGVQRVQPGDADKTLQAMRDELQRSKERLALQAPGESKTYRPYFIEYRLLDLELRTVAASFGAIVSSTTNRNRFMNVDVRVGDYQLDSSNFVADDIFRGFIGSTGTVGIDRDYESLRQDLWLATDQSFKEAVDTLGRKQGFLRSLSKPPEIADFTPAPPLVLIAPRVEPDFASRDWEAEARSASAILRNYPQIYSTRVTYHLICATAYLMTSEGTEIRQTRTLAAIEASLETQADDGMPLHQFYTAYVPLPSQLPSVEQVRKELERTAKELLALREAKPLPDDAAPGPVLFENQAAGALLAQMLGPSLGGARPPLSMLPMFDQIMDRVGGRSEWTGRAGTRVLPNSVTLTDDPLAGEFGGRPLMGGYSVDEEGVRAQRVVVVDNGILRNLLMSRRPGPDFDRTNGHGRASFLGDARPTMSNLLFTSSDASSATELRQKFLEKCREEGRSWCLVVRKMDNPGVGLHEQEDLQELIAGFAAGAATGDRLPLVVYKVNAADGSEELVRGARISGLTLRALRNIAGIGSDAAAYNFMLNTQAGLGGTALGAFGNAQGGLPASVVAPSLLFEDVEVRGPRGGQRRAPLLPSPPLN